jgi:hypothetical protein
VRCTAALKFPGLQKSIESPVDNNYKAKDLLGTRAYGVFDD